MAPARRWIGLSACALLLAPLAGGCGLSSLTSGLGGGVLGGSKSASGSGGNSVSEETMLAAAKSEQGVTGSTSGDVPGGCPRFTTWSRDNTLTIYESGKVGDGLAIMHRGEITRTARECSFENGRVTVRYGFSGRVLLGPRGKPGAIALPVNVFVADAKRERIATDKLKVDVNVAVENPIGYFSAVKTVTFPIAEGTRPGEYEIYVGFERNVPNAG